jgi:prevent-host-death family protein
MMSWHQDHARNVSFVHFCTLLYNVCMKVVSFTDFRNNASSFLDLVEKGEEVEIHRHGKVVARLVPPVSRKGARWKKPGLKLVTKAPSLSKAVLEDRR